MTSVADRFVQALRTFDAEAMTQLLAPDAAGWRNVGNRTRRAEEIIASLPLERTLVRSSTVGVRRHSSTEGGFVVEVVFEGTTRSGLPFHIPICIVAQVVNDRIASFNEYTDGESTLPLRQELAASPADPVGS